ncbi:(2Fe-2S)-binding protein [Candidatus Riflebacteria bacterium]
MLTKGTNIKIRLNGKIRKIPCRDSRTLLDLLRDDLHMYSVKPGGEDGATGTCNVLVNYRVVPSSMIFAHQINLMHVLTLEGIVDDPEFALLKSCLEKHGAVDCGFGTPGMIMSIWELILHNPKPTKEEIREYIDGCLNRSQAYSIVLDALVDFFKQLKRKEPVEMQDPLHDKELQIEDDDLPRKKRKSY